jgi:CBS domain containing-hemolysin-like protein
VDQAAVMLGFHADGINQLVDIGLIEALGGAPRGVQRMFAAIYIEQLGRDVKWLAKATTKIRQFHQQRNLARKKMNERQVETSQGLTVAHDGRSENLVATTLT